MTLIYDNAIYSKYRARAVTDPMKIEVGKSYYPNHYTDKPLTVARILTSREFGVYFHGRVEEDRDDVEPHWIIDTNGREHSLHDHNIGAAYNPWMLFEDEAIALACKNELRIEYIRDDYFDDFDYDDVYETEDVE